MSENNIGKNLSVLVPLKNFLFHNHPGCQNNESGDTGSGFIGRTVLLKRFVAALDHAHSGRGSFLVSGFRGAGKTAFVKKGIDEYKKRLNNNGTDASDKSGIIEETRGRKK
ncbi:MAG: ATP-binding protein [Pseudomonadota bacterium]